MQPFADFFGVLIRPLGWIGDRFHDFLGVDPGTKLAIVQTGIGVVVGFWVFFRYKQSRAGQASMRTGLSVCWIPGERRREGLFHHTTGQPFLMVRCHIINAGRVRVRRVTAALLIFDASHLSSDGGVKLRPLADADPLRPINADLSEPDTQGYVTFEMPPPARWYRLWARWAGQVLEPGECTDTEIAFALPNPPPVRVALRLTATGKQGFRGWFDWGMFGFVTPRNLTPGGYCSLTTHDGATQGTP